MKNNTNLTKSYLEQALKNVPDDFALFDVKNHIRIAIKKINEVENKREKRENLKNKRITKLKLNSNSIHIIDKMIEEETKKLDKVTELETFLE